MKISFIEHLKCKADDQKGIGILSTDLSVSEKDFMHDYSVYSFKLVFF